MEVMKLWALFVHRGRLDADGRFNCTKEECGARRGACVRACECVGRKPARRRGGPREGAMWGTKLATRTL